MSAFLQMAMYFSVLIFVTALGKFFAVKWVKPNSRFADSQIIFPSLMGTAALVCGSVALNYLGLAMKWVAVLSLVPTGIGLWYIIHGNTFTKTSQEEWFTVFCGGAAGLCILTPLLIFHSFNPYNDTFTYLCIADYLVDHGFLNNVEKSWANVAVVSQIDLYHDMGYRMGVQYVLALFTALFQRSFSIETYLPVAGIGVFLYVGAMWVFSRFGLKLSSRQSGIAVIFTALHFTFVVGPASNGFLPQTFGLSFFMVTLACLLMIAEHPFLRHELLGAGIFVAAIILTYSEVSPFLFLCGVSLLVHSYWVDKRHAQKELQQYWMVAGSGIILAQYGSFQAVKAILSQLHAIVGWDVPYTIWQYWTQILSIAPAHFGNMAVVMAHQWYYAGMSCVGLAAVMILSKGAANLHEERTAIRKLEVLGVPFAFLILYFMLAVPNPWHPGITGQTWSVYKVVQYGFILFPPAFAVLWYRAFSLNRFWRRGSQGAGIAVLVLMLAVFGASLNHQVGPMKRATGNSANPIQEYYKMRDAVKKSGDSTLNIVMSRDLQKHRQLVAYFLRDIKLISNWMDDGYIYPWLIPSERERTPDPKVNTLIYNLDKTNSAGLSIGANMKVVTPGAFRWNFAEGWYDHEEDSHGNQWRWANKEAVIAINLGEVSVRQVFMEFEYQSEADVLHIASDIDQLTIQLKAGEWTPFSGTINVSATSNQLRFIKEHEGKVRPGGDTRKLGFAIRNLKVSGVKEASNPN